LLEVLIIETARDENEVFDGEVFVFFRHPLVLRCVCNGECLSLDLDFPETHERVLVAVNGKLDSQVGVLLDVGHGEVDV
jgi:hypothetical protein